MKSFTVRLLLIALIGFAVVALDAGGGRRLLAQTSECNENGTGDRCGTYTRCTSWKLTSGEISTTGAGVGATCATSVEIYLFKAVTCIYCHYPIGGSGGSSGGSSGSSGGTSGGSSGSTNPCGDPNLWSDDGAGCDRETQLAS
jgi:hypothetical protein